MSILEWQNWRTVRLRTGVKYWFVLIGDVRQLPIKDTPTCFSFAKILTDEVVFYSEQCIFSKGCDIFLASNRQTNMFALLCLNFCSIWIYVILTEYKVERLLIRYLTRGTWKSLLIFSFNKTQFIVLEIGHFYICYFTFCSKHYFLNFIY